MRHQTGRDDAARGAATPRESPWSAIAAVVAAVILCATLPEKLTLGPRWLLPVLEGALLPPLIFTLVKPFPKQTRWQRLAYLAWGEDSRWQQAIFLALIAAVNAANIASLVLLVHELLNGAKTSGYHLVFSAIQIWLTNVIVFALWYWQLDCGGPSERCLSHHRRPDFVFPQLLAPMLGPPAWKPTFMDYLYIAFSNASTFGPTESHPLTPRAKFLMLIQSLTSLLTIALVAARAVGMLS